MHSAAVKTDGSLWVWGSNTDGRLGLGKDYDGIVVPTPTKLGTFTAAVPEGSKPVSTPPSSWAEKEVDEAISIGLVPEALRNTYTASITRAEFCSLAIALYESFMHRTITERATFSDTSDVNVQKMAGLGVVNGVGNGKFASDSNLIRQQAATIHARLAEVMRRSLTDGSVAFADKGRIASWAYTAVGQVQASGIMNGVGDNTFSPAGSYTREQSILTILRLLRFAEKAPEQFEIALSLDGGDGEKVIFCCKGNRLLPPDNPAKDGLYFGGWFKDKACTKAWNFDKDTVSSNLTLYAKWIPKTTVTDVAEVSNELVQIDGKEVKLSTYTLLDAQGTKVNFVKLRDIAYLLDGTAAQFNVDWRENAIRVEPDSPYTTQNGAEVTMPTVISAPTGTCITPVITNGVNVPLEAFHVVDKAGGNNYFKLNDIAKVANFNMEWDSDRSCIIITTTKDYKD